MLNLLKRNILHSAKNKSNMKLRILFTFLLLSLCLTATFAQSNFRRGFIITNEQDTVSGWIDFRTDVRNMQVCDFRETETGETRTFLPGEIFGYRFYDEGKFYVSREIMINNAPRTVFLEFIVQGMMNLYYYIETLPDTHEVVEHYFFEDAAGRIIPVSKRPNRLDSVARGVVVEREDLRYRGAIRYIFNEHETIAKQADGLRFNHQAMINLAREYHDLTCPIGEECIIFETQQHKGYFEKLEFSVYGGVLLFGSPFPDFIPQKTVPIVGGRLNIYAPRIDENLSVQVDLGLSLLSNERHTSFIFPIQLGGKYAFWENHKMRSTVGAGGYWFSVVRTHQTARAEYRLFAFFYASLGVEFPINNQHTIFVDAELAGGFSIKAGFRF